MLKVLGHFCGQDHVNNGLPEGSVFVPAERRQRGNADSPTAFWLKQTSWQHGRVWDVCFKNALLHAGQGQPDT